jgi:type I restriction enzyme S subunit
MHAGRFLREVRITTNIAHLSATRLKSVEFPIPPIEEQRKIVAEVKEKLDGVERLSQAVMRTASQSAALRRSLLAVAFEGNLLPQNTADEPASVLLDQIKRSGTLSHGRRTRRAASNRIAKVRDDVSTKETLW